MFDVQTIFDGQTLQAAVEAGWMQAVLSTVLLALVLLIVRAVVSRWIKRTVPSADLRRRWLVQTRTALLLLLALGVVIIWGSELRTLALSVVAIAVALVVATKELILCVMGSMLKAGARAFTIGDRIQVRDIRGDVIDQNLLATKVMEIGPGRLTHQRTGRVIVIPNALFMSEPVINESFAQDYVLHVFTVPFRLTDDWRAARSALLAAARRQAEPYMDEVRTHMQRIAERQALDVPSVEPRVTLQIPAAGEVHLIVRVPAEARRRGHIEQAILAECFEHTDYLTPPQGPAEAGGRKP